MENKSDLFFLIILIIIVSAFIGLNIIRIVDTRMKQISIKIPTINIPPTKIEISLSKEDKKLLFTCGANGKKRKNFVKKSSVKKNKKKHHKLYTDVNKETNFEDIFNINKESKTPKPSNFEDILTL